MEIEMEKMVKENEKATHMANTIIEALPITTPWSIVTRVGSSIEQLARSMESMNLQTEEIKTLETQVSVL